jgi:hypothetical protein
MDSTVKTYARRPLPRPAEARLLVVGLARNAGGRIGTDIDRLRRALASFRSVQWLVVESDSSDGTVADLDRLRASTPGFAFISLGKLQDQLPLRTQRIAHCRNAYLEAIESQADYAGVDLVVMADLDGINDRVDEAAILSCWARDDWDVCTANQAGPYYDIWALRHALWSPNDYIASYRFLVEHGIDQERALQSTLQSRMITIPAEASWIPVDSAFGGLAIYRREILHGFRYQGLADDGRELCEHVPMHAAIRARGGSLFINPRLICSGANEHTQTLALSKKLERQLRRMAKRVLVAIWPGRFSRPGIPKEGQRAG